MPVEPCPVVRAALAYGRRFDLHHALWGADGEVDAEPRRADQECVLASGYEAEGAIALGAPGVIAPVLAKEELTESFWGKGTMRHEPYSGRAQAATGWPWRAQGSEAVGLAARRVRLGGPKARQPMDFDGLSSGAPDVDFRCYPSPRCASPLTAAAR